MSLPVVQNRATGRSSTTDLASHPITIPTGLVAGDMLVVVFSSDGNPVITVGSGAGWTKLGQLGDATGAVTSAIFWKIASGSDVLTLATSTTEQSSHVTFRIRPALEIAGTSSRGSSTNSDPPANVPAAGLQDYLFIATRSGDSTVVATAPPSSFANMQTIAAAGANGASTNTAEVSAAASTGTDPAVFTSATEQWVSWTLAVFSRSVSQDLIPTYQLSSSAQADIVCGYLINGTVVANPWFARLTSGYNTWGGFGSSLLQVQRDFTAQYQMAGTVLSDLTATYSVSVTTSVQNTSWFAILTNGFNTWAGGTVTNPTAGQIVGAVTLPISAEQTYSATYSVQMAVFQDRVLTYQVRSAVQRDLVPVFSITNAVTQDRLATYSMLGSAQADRPATYQVFGAVQSDLSPVYGVLTSAQKDLAPVYTINTTPLTAGANFTATYTVRNSAQADLVPVFTLFSSVQKDLAPDYLIYLSAEADLDVSYQLQDSPSADLIVAWSISGKLDDGVMQQLPHRSTLTQLPHQSRLTQH